jgi:uncharacterized protein (TIGR00725 family)
MNAPSAHGLAGPVDFDELASAELSVEASRVVCVFGGSADVCRSPAVCQLAEATGRTLAELGYVVANGGYGGTMEACSRGAKQAGGRTVGVLCSLWKAPANPYVDEAIVTGDFTERLLKLLEISSAGYVVLPGANGTLTEMALAWERKSVRRQHQRPIVCVGRFWQPVITLMVSLRPASAAGIAVVDEPAELRRYFPAVKPA